MNSNIDFDNTSGEHFRLHVANKITKMLELDYEKDAVVGRNIEKTIYNHAIQEAQNKSLIKKWDNPFFRILYLTRLKSILSNLKHNTEFREQILNKQISYKQLAQMTHQEMDPKRWETQIKEKIERDKAKYETQKRINSEFTCFKCKSNNCDYYQLQTRSADEPMTTFVSCLDCGNRWKC